MSPMLVHPLPCRACLRYPVPGNFVSSSTQYPTSSWLPESVASLLAEGTKLKYIVYTHAHWVSVTCSPLVDTALWYSSITAAAIVASLASLADKKLPTPPARRVGWRCHFFRRGHLRQLCGAGAAAGGPVAVGRAVAPRGVCAEAE